MAFALVALRIALLYSQLGLRLPLSDPGTEHEEVLVGNRAVTRDKARAATAGKNVTDGHTLVHTQGAHTHTTHCP